MNEAHVITSLVVDGVPQFSEGYIYTNDIKEGVQQVRVYYRLSDVTTHSAQHWITNVSLVPAPSANKTKAVVVDIDGVLNYIDGPMIELDNGSTCHWMDFVTGQNAKVNKTMADAIRGWFRSGHRIIFLTARGESQRIATNNFLRKAFGELDFDLFMRGANQNNVTAPVIKSIILNTCILPYVDVKMFVDDTQTNIDMIKKTNPEIQTLKVN